MNWSKQSSHWTKPVIRTKPVIERTKPEIELTKPEIQTKPVLSISHSNQSTQTEHLRQTYGEIDSFLRCHRLGEWTSKDSSCGRCGCRGGGGGGSEGRSGGGSCLGGGCCSCSGSSSSLLRLVAGEILKCRHTFFVVDDNAQELRTEIRSMS